MCHQTDSRIPVSQENDSYPAMFHGQSRRAGVLLAEGRTGMALPKGGKRR